MIYPISSIGDRLFSKDKSKSNTILDCFQEFITAIINKDGEIIGTNDQFNRKLHYSLRDIGTLKLKDIISEFADENFIKQFKQTLEQHKQWIELLQVQDKFGNHTTSIIHVMEINSGFKHEQNYVVLISPVGYLNEYERLRKLAYTDELTQLPNYRKLQEQLVHYMKENTTFALLFLDIDQFKKINDQYGHLAGDYVLQASSLRLLQVVNSDGELFRKSGDEFIVIVNRMEQLDIIKSDIQRKFEKPLFIMNHAVNIRFSIGVSIYPTHGQDKDSLLAFADRKMYNNKNTMKKGANMVQSTSKNGEVLVDDMLTEHQFKQLFQVFKENVVRTRRSITMVFICIYEPSNNDAEENSKVNGNNLTSILLSKIRQTDVLFQSSDDTWCLLLPQSGETEAFAFLKRLFQDIKSMTSPSPIPTFGLSASLAEIRNNKVIFEELMDAGRQALNPSIHKDAWEIHIIKKYKEKPMEKIKISILEDNPIFQHVLRQTLENLSINHFQLDIKTFQDGYSFLESDWYLSGHTHILIMNDLLPRKNGIDVLHTIRRLPNTQKFIVFMMTKRQSEEDMIYAYLNGVDGYFVKPFNIRLFEAQIKRTFERLWS